MPDPSFGPRPPFKPLKLRVKELREARGLSQPELARLAGCAIPTIIRLERGEGGPNRADLVSLRAVLFATLGEPHAGAERRAWLAGRYSANAEPNLDVYLKAHNAETVRVDRINRPPEFVERPALTMGLAVQTHVIRELGQKAGLRGRGLLARFLYALPADNVGYRRTNAPPASAAAATACAGRLRALLALPVPPEPAEIALSPEAERALVEFEAAVEVRLRRSRDLGHIRDWGGKLAGAVGRLAGLLHCAEHADTPILPWERPIGGETMRAAVRLGEYFAAHAKIAFEEMRRDPAVADALYVLRVLGEKAKPVVSRHDLWDSVKRHFHNRAEPLDKALTLLVGHGYIRERPVERKPGQAGRPPAPDYEINPELLGNDTPLAPEIPSAA
jgi:transcriptional regulator with XRE-family HTH domain